MVVKVATKKKSSTSKKTDTASVEKKLAKTADVIYDTEQEIQALELKLSQTKTGEQLQALREKLAEEKATIDPMVESLNLGKDESQDIVGVKAKITIGKKAIKREVRDVTAVYDALHEVEEDLPYELMSFKLGDLDKHLTSKELKDLLKVTQNGNRKISIKAI